MPARCPHLCGADDLVEETNTVSRTHSSLLVGDEEEEEDSASVVEYTGNREDRL